MQPFFLVYVMIASELAWCLSMLRGIVTWVIDLIEA
jgi:hypothetical protein